MGAADDSPLLQPFCDALGLQPRSKQEILDDPDFYKVVEVHLVATFSAAATPSSYEVLELVPSGLAPLDLWSPTPWVSPYRIEGQTVRFNKKVYRRLAGMRWPGSGPGGYAGPQSQPAQIRPPIRQSGA